jgi:hypothetical protein
MREEKRGPQPAKRRKTPSSSKKPEIMHSSFFKSEGLI